MIPTPAANGHGPAVDQKGISAASGPPSIEDILLRTVGTSQQTCGCEHERGRNLVVCIDGTSNKFGEKNTNVIELYSLIRQDGARQVTYYNSGIGTFVPHRRLSYRRWKQKMNSALDMAIAYTFKDTLLDAYRWLSENHEPGDRIFLFGFSRGAYQVRALSGMIEKVGLIYKGNERQIPFAYELYFDQKTNEPQLSKAGVASSIGDGDLVSKAERFKRTFSRREVKVHFVGVWDTVSSIGWVRGVSLPHSTDGMQHVCYFRHALALDERRVKFLPEYAYGGTSATFMSQWPNQSKEVWFAGTHGDIGGGNTKNLNLDQSRPSLRWICFEAMEAGLELEPFRRTLEQKASVKAVRESLKGPWHILEYLPVKRLRYGEQPKVNSGKRFTLSISEKHSERAERPATKPRQEFTARGLHRGAGREMVFPGQAVHSSVFRVTHSEYHPHAKPVGPESDGFWQNFFKHGPTSESSWAMLELDPYDSLPHYLRIFSDWRRKEGPLADKTRRQISAVVTSPTMQWALAQRLHGDSGFRNSAKNLNLLQAIYGDTKPLHMLPRAEMRPLFVSLESDGEHDTVRKFLSRFTLAPNIHAAANSVGPADNAAFSSNGSKVAVLVGNATSVQIWDIKIRPPAIKASITHPSPITAFAWSHDDRHIASALLNNTIVFNDGRDTAQGHAVGEPLRGHARPVACLAFSLNGRWMASGAADGIIIIWRLAVTSEGALAICADGTISPARGFNNVTAVAFSPDSELLVWGTSDGDCFVWNMRGRSITKQFSFDRLCWVLTIKFPPDHGSKSMLVLTPPRPGISKPHFDDLATKAANICDLGTEEYQTLKGHTAPIFDGIFSLDGRHIFTLCADEGIRAWDTDTKEKIDILYGFDLQPYRRSSFSPNRRSLLSSRDGEPGFRLWNIEWGDEKDHIHFDPFSVPSWPKANTVRRTSDPIPDSFVPWMPPIAQTPAMQPSIPVPSAYMQGHRLQQHEEFLGAASAMAPSPPSRQHGVTSPLLPFLPPLRPRRSGAPNGSVVHGPSAYIPQTHLDGGVSNHGPSISQPGIDPPAAVAPSSPVYRPPQPVISIMRPASPPSPFIPQIYMPPTRPAPMPFPTPYAHELREESFPFPVRRTSSPLPLTDAPDVDRALHESPKPNNPWMEANPAPVLGGPAFTIAQNDASEHRDLGYTPGIHRAQTDSPVSAADDVSFVYPYVPSRESRRATPVAGGFFYSAVPAARSSTMLLAGSPPEADANASNTAIHHAAAKSNASSVDSHEPVRHIVHFATPDSPRARTDTGSAPTSPRLPPVFHRS